MTSTLTQVSNEEISPEAATIALQIAFPNVNPERIKEMVDAAAKFTPVKPDPLDGLPGQPGDQSGDPSAGAAGRGGKIPGSKPKVSPDKNKLKRSLEGDGFSAKDAKHLVELVYGADE